MKQSSRRLLLIRAAAINGFPRALAAGLLLLGSSCASSVAMREPGVSSPSGVTHAIVTDAGPNSQVDMLSHEQGAAEPFLASSDPFQQTTRIQQIGFAKIGAGNGHASGIQTVSYQTAQNSQTPGVVPVSTTYEAEPRVAIDDPTCPPGFCPPGVCPPHVGAAQVAATIPRPFPGPEYVGEEYICDGGDEGVPVHYNGTVRMGLDTEDTVVEFRDHTGEQHVKPSTRTCVYAPRFAAVRSATLPQLGYSVDKLAGHQDQAAVVGLDTHLTIDEQVQQDEVRGMLMRSRVSGIEGDVSEDRLNQTLAVENHVKLFNVYEDYRIFRDGQFDRTNSAVIGEAVDAALEWSDGQAVRIVAHDRSGQIVQSRATAQDYTGIEDRRTKGDLDIVKIADRHTAQPGDVITFTIRFDNRGDRELLGVRVIDNLSARLELIDGSIDSSYDGKLDVAANGAGGQLLTFEFSEPLAGKTGGYVSFQCRVR